MTTKHGLFFALLALVGTSLMASTARAGYTHCFTWHQKPDADMRQVVDAAKGILAGPDGTGAPLLRDSQVEFNGLLRAAVRDPLPAVESGPGL